ncbi:MAG: hypothetical protein RR851_13020 [Clostridium sp.]
MLLVGDKVKIKYSDMVAIVSRVGGGGLYLVTIKTPHSGFERTVYGEWELDKIGGLDSE